MPDAPDRTPLLPGGAGLRGALAAQAARRLPGPYLRTVPSGAARPAPRQEPQGA